MADTVVSAIVFFMDMDEWFSVSIRQTQTVSSTQRSIPVVHHTYAEAEKRDNLTAMILPVKAGLEPSQSSSVTAFPRGETGLLALDIQTERIGIDTLR